MKLATLVGCLLIVTAAFAQNECEKLVSGNYTNPDYNKLYNSYVEVTGTKAQVFIPCGSKADPAAYELVNLNCNEAGSAWAELKLVKRGGGQCSLGEKPFLFVSENQLKIATDIRVPGFNGNYYLTK